MAEAFVHLDACQVLRDRASILDVKDLPFQWQLQVKTCKPGPIDGLKVAGKFGPEDVIVCQSQLSAVRGNPDRSEFYWSKYVWLQVEANSIYCHNYFLPCGPGKRPCRNAIL